MLDSEGYACHFCVKDWWVGAQVVDGFFVLVAGSSTVVLLVLLARSTSTAVTGYSSVLLVKNFAFNHG
jgi:hypothetical protein